MKTHKSYSGFYELIDGQSNMNYPVWKKKMDPEVYIYYSDLRWLSQGSANERSNTILVEARSFIFGQ